MVCVEFLQNVWIAANPTEIMMQKDAEDNLRQGAVLNMLVV